MDSHSSPQHDGEEVLPVYNIILTGSRSVGKTNLIVRATDERRRFVGEVLELDAEHIVKIVNIDEKRKVELRIRDIEPEVHNFSMKSPNYRLCQAVLLCVDLTNEESFEELQRWSQDASKYGSSAFQIVVACKCDAKEKRVVSQSAMAAFCSEIGAPYIETSAKTGEGVEECFKVVANIIYELRKKPIYHTQARHNVSPQQQPQLEQQHHHHHHHSSIFGTIHSWFSKHHHKHHSEEDEEVDDAAKTSALRTNESLSEDQQQKPDYERLQKLPGVVWPPIIEAIDNSS